MSSVKLVNNCYLPAWEHRGKTVNQWGKDNTGLIEYRFNNQGFRHHSDYNWTPKIAIFGNSIVFGVGIPKDQILCSILPDCQNYGLSGNYMNWHSVENLKQFVKIHNSRIVFFWIGRNEPIEDMIQEVNAVAPNVLHISSGEKQKGAINLMPAKDADVSGTHPGPKTHAMWARTIELLLNRA